MSPVSPPAKVLVTGVNGYLGAWAARKFLEAGYAVRGTVRSTAKSGAYLKDLFGLYGDIFELVQVNDITAPGVFDEHVQGVHAIAHVASPFSSSSIDVDANVKPAVEGTTSIIKSAVLYGASLQRFVLLGSIVSAIDGSPVLSESSWNEWAPKAVEGRETGSDPWTVYCASKSLAERAAWNLVKEKQPSWDFVALNPPYLFGPAIHDVPNATSLNASLVKLLDLLIVDINRPTERLQSEYVATIDVRDAAQLLVESVKRPGTGGGRFIPVMTGAYDQRIVDVANSLSPPPLTKPLTKGVPGSTDDKALPISLELQKTVGVFSDFKFIPLEQMLRESLEYFKEKGFAD